MAEYKGKLLKGLFTRVENVLLGDGTSLKTVSDSRKIVILTGTMPNNGSGINIPYPTGFDVDNTVIVRAEVLSGVFWSDMINGNVGIQVAMSASNGIGIFTRDSAFVGQSFRIYITKYGL